MVVNKRIEGIVKSLICHYEQEASYKTKLFYLNNS